MLLGLCYYENLSITLTVPKGAGLSRLTELAVLRARVPDRQSGVRRPFLLELRKHSSALRRRFYRIMNNNVKNVCEKNKPAQ